MSRPLKVGIEYFPLDVHMNDSMKLIEAEFGLKGFAIVVKLWQKIYSGQGYYCEWTNEVELLFKHDIGIVPGDNSVSEIVNACIKRGIFDKRLYETYGILTSIGIQKRYFKITGRRQDTDVKSEYLLFNPAHNAINVNKNGVNVCNNSINADINSQSKVKESKGNKSKISIPAGIEPEWKEYVQMRICIKKPMTEKAKQLALKKLQDLSNGDITKMKAILNQSIFNSWQGLFPLKEGMNVNGEDRQSDTAGILEANPYGIVL